MTVRQSVIILVAGLFFPFSAIADEQIPIKNVSELKGKWAGPGGIGPFGQTAGASVEYSIKDDGTYTGVLTTRSNQRVNFQGTFEPKPDGSASVSSTGSTATWRLFNVNGNRVLRIEGRNRSTGQSNWGEATEVK